MFTLSRISTTPASPMRCIVAQPTDEDAGLNSGGSFYFQPAPTPGVPLAPDRSDGDHQAGMSEFAARAIMSDPGLATHFTCDPPLPPLTPAPPADPTPVAPATEPASMRRRTPAPPADPAA
jgi:hypothetical protein